MQNPWTNGKLAELHGQGLRAEGDHARQVNLARAANRERQAEIAPARTARPLATAWRGLAGSLVAMLAGTRVGVRTR